VRWSEKLSWGDKGVDVDARYEVNKAYNIKNGMLDIPVIKMNKFTAIEFIRTEKTAKEIADEKAEEETRIKAEQEAKEKAEQEAREADQEDQAGDEEQSPEEGAE
jgi:hypothetical protein